ncbi:MAG: hypothetical protein IV088_02920 [Hydrogenophaga sp.]|uniref:hypothetical protein n=1 Tax=Hydrogenophaga sp. TaxID=1904254 RepID=UPI0025BFD984|nr:hypothetical protein [Hydrogenophaga sp.]MBT9549776.1 hypothetical protein [Hydrogenophaga sp.]
MNPDQIILISPQGWFQFKEGHCLPLEPWSGLEGSALVVVDFEQSQSGVQACKGKAEYAAALIEKNVRTEGLVEGPLQVFIHKQIRHTDSTLALFTAVPLDAWQQLQTWAQGQRDHCLVAPLIGLLPAMATEGRAHVLRAGTQLHAYSESDGKMHYAGATALGTDVADMQAPLRALMAQLRASAGGEASQGMLWSSTLTDDVGSEQTLASKLAELSSQEVKLVPHDTLRGEGTDRRSSSLSHLIGAAGQKAVQASGLAKLAWMSESYVLPLAAMIAVVAVGLGGFAVFSHQRAQQETQVAASMQGDMEGLRQRVALVNQAAPVPELDASMALTRQLGHAAIYDPVQMLDTIRRAAGAAVRVQNVQLVKADATNKARFRVDGVVIDGRNEELSRFLTELKREGWQAEPANPGDNSVGAFAYQLKPVVNKSL